ncbi:VOC family protein [Leeuwenhoekiella polynyae]|uniref:Catechol-2,3-dioxygenase n=1 Tax=Leeuwenhoekiella polynyae TaxID=1550906 RepID=A0A4Q0P1Z3_9FLAO|nr:VOC family protein [Leeuwenhoekiella polynyae]RXG20544.1 catechol-2,3-dioxygenase [Leeuwenhoekiella polynyae]
MKIQELKVYTPHLNLQRLFYEETLGLEAFNATNDRFSVKLGESILVFEERETATPYHFAITIPSNKEKEALIWLKQRVDILNYEGNTIQEFKNWNAKAIYFYDADHNIVEFIARNTLNNQTSDGFSKAQLLEISEIGLPTDAIEQSFIILNKTPGLEVYDGNFERFCAVGDANGLIILIDKNSRKWFPTNDTAYPSDFSLIAKVDRATFRIEYKNEILKAEPITTTSKQNL